MDGRIPELLTSRKAKDISLILSIILLGITSFGLGRLSVDEERAAVVLHAAPQRPTDATSEAGTGNNLPAAHLVTVGTALPDTETGTTTTAPRTSGTLVGSKNGTVYHLPWCSGAQRIKPANRVWFDSKADAEAAGYHAASNCKGL